MKCEESRVLIEEFFDGELNDRLAANMKSHVDVCDECAVFWGELQREQEVYLRYQRDVEITPAIWAAVQTRIAQEATEERVAPVAPSLFDRIRAWLGSSLSAPRMSFAYTAALVLIAIGATVAVMSYMNSHGNGTNEMIARDGKEAQPPVVPANPPQPVTPDANDNVQNNNGDKVQPSESAGNDTKPSITPSAPRRNAVKPKAPTPEQLVREAEQKYLAAIAILTKDVNKRHLDPLVKARFDSALAAIDRTIEETRQAARKNPNDPAALQYMLAAYAKKVDVLRDIADD